jgi:hypothetical protein
MDGRFVHLDEAKNELDETLSFPQNYVEPASRTRSNLGPS